MADDNKTDTDGCERATHLLNDETCHSLPCKIDYQGMAPTHLYFRPVPLAAGQTGTVDGDERDDSCYAAMIRGRGLLAVDPQSSSSDVKVQAALLSVQTHNGGSVRVIRDDISAVVDWYHEHNQDNVLYSDQYRNHRTENGMEWLTVAEAVSFYQKYLGTC